MNGDLTFAPEPSATDPKAGRLHKVLVVDDDPEVHAVTRLMLASLRYEGRKIELLHAHSAAEAREFLARHPGIALVLLDVVMETDRSGLDLVRYIRDDLGNSGIRIALRTGQPGQVSENQIVSQYAIDDYVLKSELTYLRVQTLVTTALRTYELLRRLERSESDLRKANLELERLAQTDPLTGLWNRRRFDEELSREWRRLTREGLPVAALMIDVDYFKDYNDTAGHPAGDLVLASIARVLGDTIRRAGDLLCRYGGEEFLAILPGTSPAEALKVAESVRLQVLALALPHAHSTHALITVSVGCSNARPKIGSDPGAATLVNAADQALYKAKRAGRNRVESADPLD